MFFAVSKSPEKSVRFSNEFNQKSTSKKDTIKPLQLNVVSMLTIYLCVHLNQFDFIHDLKNYFVITA